jgi:hypothetical protein
MVVGNVSSSGGRGVSLAELGDGADKHSRRLDVMFSVMD